MRIAFTLSTLVMLLAPGALTACEADSSTPQPGADAASSDAPNADGSAATGAKGDPCTTDADCVEDNAKCRAGNLCTGALDEAAFQTECATGGAGDCPGLSCVGLKENVQGKTGICSMPCETDEDCGPDAACSSLGIPQKVCLHVCKTSDDCLNGYVCVANAYGAGSACLVEPIEG